jgi:hypothetical protein
MNTRLVVCALSTIAALSSSIHAAPGDFRTGQQGTTPLINNWPMNEPPSLALDGNSGTKYLNFAEDFTGLALTLASPGAVNSISFNSANDAAERNPTTFSLYGSNSVTITGAEPTNSIIFNLSSFSPIVLDLATGFNASTPIFTNSIVSFTNLTGFSTYLLVFPTVANASTANSMQIGDAVLRVAGAPVVTALTPVAGGELEPVPEPGSMAMVSLASVGLLALRRRRH